MFCLNAWITLSLCCRDIINYGEERRNDHSALVSKLETYAFSAPADDNSDLPDKTGIEQFAIDQYQEHIIRQKP